MKMVLVGAPQVGKTSIALRYTQDTMNKAYQVSARPLQCVVNSIVFK